MTGSLGGQALPDRVRGHALNRLTGAGQPGWGRFDGARGGARMGAGGSHVANSVLSGGPWSTADAGPGEHGREHWNTVQEPKTF